MGGTRVRLCAKIRLQVDFPQCACVMEGLLVNFITGLKVQRVDVTEVIKQYIFFLIFNVLAMPEFRQCFCHQQRNKDYVFQSGSNSLLHYMNSLVNVGDI